MDEREEKLIEQGRRVESIINEEGLTQAEFSELTGIKTSTLNHVIKGRNNISPMVMYQILSAFPIYNEEWIRDGYGARTKDMSSTSNQDSISTNTSSNDTFHSTLSRQGTERTLFSAPSDPLNSSFARPKQTNPTISENHSIKPQTDRKITKIIVYYDDNTFETFTHFRE